MKLSKCISVDQAADIVGRSKDYIYARVKSGEIPAYNLSGWRIPEDAFAAWLESKSNRRAALDSISRFQRARDRVRSLTTEDTVQSPEPALKKGVG